MAITNTSITVTGDTVVTGNITNFLDDNEKNGISFNLTNAYDDSIILTATKPLVSINLTGSITEYNALDINHGAGYISSSGTNEFTIMTYDNPTTINITSYLSDNEISISKLTVDYLDGTSESAEYIQPMREATLAEKLAYLNETKTEIKNVLISKGKATASDNKFRDYPKMIEEIRQEKITDDFSGWPNNGGKYEVTIFDYDGTILYHNWLNEGDTFSPPDVPWHEHIAFDYWCSDWDYTGSGEIGNSYYDYPENGGDGRWHTKSGYGWKNVDYVVTVGNTDIVATPRYITRDPNGVYGRYPTRVRIKLTPQTGLTVKYSSPRATYSSSGTTYQQPLYWGDGTNTGTAYNSSSWSNTTHTYDDYGEYEIVFLGVTGSSGYSFNAAGFTPVSAITELYAGQGERLTTSGCNNLSVITTGSCSTIGIGSTSYSQSRSIKTAYYGPDNGTYVNIPDYAFYNCSNLEYCALSPWVNVVGSSFYGCRSLKSVQLSPRITLIGRYAFRECEKLANLRFGPLVTSIGDSAFLGCYNLKEFDFSKANSVPTLYSASVFTDCHPLYKILVPPALLYDFVSAWNSSSVVPHIVAATEWPDAYIIKGSPTITNNVASGFSDSNFLLSENVINNNPLTSFELVTAVNMNTASTTDGLGICDAGVANATGLRLTTSSTNTVKLRISTTGGQAYPVNITGITDLTVGTKVFIKVVYDSSTGYELFTSTDGVNWTSEGASNITTKPYQSACPLKWGDSAETGSSLDGSIYLEDTYININGSRVWEAVPQS